MLWLRLLLLLFCLSTSLISFSLLSTKSIKSLKLADPIFINRLDLLDWTSSSATSGSGINFMYWQNTLTKNAIKARRHAMPHMRKRPQKLLRDSLFESISSSCAVQSCFRSHLSWIFCRSPFSESWRMAVDISTARGESLWNAWDQVSNIRR